MNLPAQNASEENSMEDFDREIEAEYEQALRTRKEIEAQTAKKNKERSGVESRGRQIDRKTFYQGRDTRNSAKGPDSY